MSIQKNPRETIDPRSNLPRSHRNAPKPPPPNHNQAVQVIREIVTTIVAQSPGYPLQPIIGNALSQVPAEYHESATYAEVSRIVWDLCASGELVSLEIRPGSGVPGETIYYPKGYSFKATPRNTLMGEEKPPKKLLEPLPPAQTPITEALTTLIDSCNNTVRLRIISRYCNRCGEVKEGHFCNE